MQIKCSKCNNTIEISKKKRLKNNIFEKSQYKITTCYACGEKNIYKIVDKYSSSS